MLPETLDLDEASANDPDAYPITLTVRHLSEEQSNPSAFKGETNGTRSGLFRSSLLSAAEEEKLYNTEGSAVVETVKAKYLVGCDGAHSWTRRQLGIRMIGDQTNHVWGVLDMVPLTNFPDIRMRCAVHSANSGSVMVIPQPEGLVRLYIQLPIQVKQGEYLDRSQITPESIMSTARKILHPYTLETDHIEWYTGYHIGQRMTESFGRANRIFLAGDACHTHSPKAGQGMNTSMQDTWNLCWKLASVLTGSAKPDLLRTYATEREVVAKTLIDFDTKFSKLFSGKPAAEADVEKDGVDLKEFKDVFATSESSSPRRSASARADFARKTSRSLLQRRHVDQLRGVLRRIGAIEAATCAEARRRPALLLGTGRQSSVGYRQPAHYPYSIHRRLASLCFPRRRVAQGRNGTPPQALGLPRLA